MRFVEYHLTDRKNKIYMYLYLHSQGWSLPHLAFGLISHLKQLWRICLLSLDPWVLSL